MGYNKNLHPTELDPNFYSLYEAAIHFFSDLCNFYVKLFITSLPSNLDNNLLGLFDFISNVIGY